VATNVYRAIVIFGAADDTEAKAQALKAAQLVKGKLDRLTVRRETWGEVAEAAPTAK
jgi:hypothetical protein